MATVVLGFQSAGAPEDSDRLAHLNTRLAEELCAGDWPPGLLDYRVLRGRATPERFCAYWLWRDWSCREKLFSDPIEPLRRFTDGARPLWAHLPDVARYAWDGRPPHRACEPGDVVMLSAGGRGPGRLLTEQGGERRFRWFVAAHNDRLTDPAEQWIAL